MQRKEKIVITYKCDICGHEYSDKKEAQSCESKPVTQNRGVKAGDTVFCTTGQGAGEKCVVERVYVVDKYWGHYVYERYWHTIALSVNFKIGSRHLTFDDYEVIR